MQNYHLPSGTITIQKQTQDRRQKRARRLQSAGVQQSVKNRKGTRTSSLVNEVGKVDMHRQKNVFILYKKPGDQRLKCKI